MNKAFGLFVILITTGLLHSCKKCGSDTKPYPIVPSCFFNAGSYFIYNDSIEHIIDSQYVFYYSYQSGQSTNGYMIDDCSYGFDLILMNESSFRNGLFYDNIHMKNMDPSQIYLWDSLGYYWANQGGVVFSVGNNDSFSNFSVGATVYPKVYKFNYPMRIIENTDTVALDLYFAQNYGIVKRVEHRPTGDVSWDLIRYHIVH